MHGIVRGHHGAIRVASEPGQGTTFQVLFPASDDVTPVTAKELPQAMSRMGHGIILVVDDEEIVRSMVSGMLERMGYSVLTAPSGEQAVRIYRQHQSEVACVLLDLTMPNMDGRETMSLLQQICPQVRVLLTSGYSEESATADFSGMKLAGFIQKPFEFDALSAVLHKVLGDDTDCNP